MVQWGDQEEFLRGVEMESGKTPAALQAKPELFPDAVRFINAFSFLSSSRNSGFSMGYIPLSEILAYCELFEIEDKQYFASIIRTMDSAYCEMVRDKQQRMAKKDGRRSRIRN